MASPNFKAHFLDKEAVRMGCVVALDALTPVERKSKQWKSFVKYHPKYSVAAAELKKKKKSPKKLKKKSSKAPKKPKKKMR